MLARWLKFNAIGVVGAGVQLAVLYWLTGSGMHYLLATVLAVEAALLHNYFWHLRWTWRDRMGLERARVLWRFHLANGLMSVVSNLVWMRIFTGSFGMKPVIANVLAIGLTSLLNFALGDRWVFATREP